MLTLYGSGSRQPIVVPADSPSLPDGVDWIDAFQPTADEVRALRRWLGVRIPTRDDLVEIEASSRMAVEGDTILLSVPVTITAAGLHRARYGHSGGFSACSKTDVQSERP